MMSYLMQNENSTDWKKPSSVVKERIVPSSDPAQVAAPGANYVEELFVKGTEPDSPYSESDYTSQSSSDVTSESRSESNSSSSSSSSSSSNEENGAGDGGNGGDGGDGGTDENGENNNGEGTPPGNE